jgi:Cu/Ag efflux protein CusF
MKRFAGPVAVFLLVAGLAVAQDIRRGTVKSVDPDKKTVTITADGKDETYPVTADTKMIGATSFADLKPGTAVMFKAGTRDGKAVLVGLKAGVGGGGKDQATRPPAPGKADTSKMKPLTTLGTEKYHGFEGGLYPGGSNDRPKEHEAAGLAAAKQIRPLGPDGKPAPGDKIVLLSVGMSNTTQEFSTFKRQADADKDKSPDVVIVDGAQGGMTAAKIKDTDNPAGAKYWEVNDQRLKAAGVTREQVQVAWIKEADAGPTQGFPKYAETLRDELREVVRLLHRRFPNLKVVYLSSRTYGGYAKTGLNPEPYAFESGLSVKWLIEEQIKGSKELNYDPAKGPVQAPWLSWGPYLWANGTAKNPDGLFYVEEDFVGDGTHPSETGRRKVADQLLRFLKTDSTAKTWFVPGEK